MSRKEPYYVSGADPEPGGDSNGSSDSNVGCNATIVIVAVVVAIPMWIFASELGDGMGLFVVLGIALVAGLLLKLFNW